MKAGKFKIIGHSLTIIKIISIFAVRFFDTKNHYIDHERANQASRTGIR